MTTDRWTGGGAREDGAGPKGGPLADDALELFFAAGRQAPELDEALHLRLLGDAGRVLAGAAGADRVAAAVPEVRTVPMPVAEVVAEALPELSAASASWRWVEGVRALAVAMRGALTEALGGRGVSAGLAAAGVAGLLLGFAGPAALGLTAGAGLSGGAQLARDFTLDDLEEMPDLLLAELVADGSFASDPSPAGAMP